jgi:dUTPase
MKLNRQDLYYLLGFGFYGYEPKDNGLLLTKSHRQSKPLVDISFKVFNRDIVKQDSTSRTSSIFLEDDTVVKFLNEHGATTPKRYMPSVSPECAWSFIAGYFDGHGELGAKGTGFARISVRTPTSSVFDFISKNWQVKSNNDVLTAYDYKALDICGRMYANTTLHSADHFDRYMDMLNHKWTNKAWVGKNHSFEYMKLHPHAIEPTKTHVTDSGYDLHILELTHLYTTPFGAEVYQGKTEIAIKPIVGYSFDINGRSSLPKSGWMFMQGTGICDRSYNGEIQGTFLRLKNEPLPKLPWKALQLVPREAPLHASWVEKKDLGDSMRAGKGFGSTN